MEMTMGRRCLGLWLWQLDTVVFLTDREYGRLRGWFLALEKLLYF